MSHRFTIELEDPRHAPIDGQVELGHHFVFVRDPKALVRRGRQGRLSPPSDQLTVLPVTDQPIRDVRGVVIYPRERDLAPLACLVADRDLYRAEHDTAHLLIATATPIADLTLAIEMNGEPLTERAVESSAGTLLIEPLSMLLAGRYTAELRRDGLRLGPAVEFTVAEYSLAPLSARLLQHRLEREDGHLAFELDVSSYEAPYGRAIRVTLVDGERELGEVVLDATSGGRYHGRLPLEGDGPHRLRLVATDDPSRVAEVALPGSRRSEREQTVISELGREVSYSLMPEREARPIRGGFLSEGSSHATPLKLEGVVTDRATLAVTADVRALALVTVDLATGAVTSEVVGDVDAGHDIELTASAPGKMVFAGGFVDGQPFEGYTTLLGVPRVELGVEVAAEARPGQDLEVRLTCGADQRPVPVLLSIRDQRLTATDTPSKALAAAVKRSFDTATEGMDDDVAFYRLDDAWSPMHRWDEWQVGPRDDDDEGAVTLQQAVKSPRPQVVYSAPPSRLRSVGLAQSLGGLGDMLFGSQPSEEAMAVEFEAGGAGDLDLVADAEPPGAGAPMSEGPIEPPRSSFPESILYAVVDVAGSAKLTVPLGDAATTLTIEAFALDGGDWQEVRETVRVDLPARVDLDLPPAIHHSDVVSGRIRASVQGPRLRLELSRDGEPVALASGPEHDASSVELSFPAGPGTYRADVTDPASGERDSIELHVAEPGRFRSQVKRLHLLEAGAALDLESADALSLRILPALDQPLQTMADATADYSHLCCEQTAAKIVGACFLYLSRDDLAGRRKAEEVILAGLAREKQMHRPGKGFAMYPSKPKPDSYWGPMTVPHLWTLERLRDLPDLTPTLGRAIADGIAMADDAAEAYGIARLPKRIDDPRDAWTVATHAPERAAEVRDFLARTLDLGAPEPRLRASEHAVLDRRALAYSAAALLALGERRDALRVSNLVTAELGEDGRLYSTVDSVAALALLAELRAAGVLDGAAVVRVNGEEMTAERTTELADQIESIEIIEGAVMVEVSQVVEEDWSALSTDLSLDVSLSTEAVTPGDRLSLRVALPDGYRTGDLVHVCLPAALSWIHGGGRVKRFSLDLAGEASLEVPLAVTGALDGSQRWAVCVRNMFEEERVAATELEVGG